jgi:sodium-dependent dicarboxylate transporter 2/3/5
MSGAVRGGAQVGVLAIAGRLPVDTAVVLELLALVAVLWVTEAVPLFITALLVPVVLVVAGVQPADDALAPFFHSIIALFFGGFLMVEAVRRVGLDRLAAISLIARFGSTPAPLFAAMIAMAGFLSMWMSNTTATAVPVPIALAVTDRSRATAASQNYRDRWQA